jgi:alpha-amylase/alpha-mannosidase (GH57 family)
VERYVCIHGHFYQPPRENPWLEAIELQDSAYPYHDWNERIDAECYAPNCASRILDGEGRIGRIVNNYSRISFNFGPTLIAWLQTKAPNDYACVLAADVESQQRFSGHGSAMAQAYNHMILPLANRRDKYTQILWGIRDFEQRFGRKPEGMWLPEAAVDIESLDLFAEQGIRFTVLSPHQAHRVRPIKGRAWRDVSGGRIDPTMAYRMRLPSHRTIALFFYDGPISRAVAFEGLLERGENLAERIVGSFSDARAWPQLAHIATDGETYGHHHKHGEMALSYALQYIEERGLAKLTNYGEFLANHPPTHEVQIFENSSWSCAHGIERWRSNCGCNSGGRPGWNQEWRMPLRQAFDWLRDELAPFYEQKAGDFLEEPWAARDAYIDLILNRQAENRAAFLERYAVPNLSDAEKIAVFKLLEIQRHALLMYTSCGWFFDELSGIETVQVIQYAARALQLALELGASGDLERCFLEKLELAKSNLPEHGDGRAIYEKFVRPAMVDLQKVGAHYAVSSLFGDGKEVGRAYCYTVHNEDYRLTTAGRTRLALGRARIVSEITQESAHISFGVLHLGDHNVSGGVRAYEGPEAYESTAQEITEVFRRADIPELIRVVDKNYGPGGTYSLKLLFRDEQRRVLREILASTLAEAEGVYRTMYQNHVSTMRFLASVGMPLPKQIEIAAETTLNTELRRAFESEDLDLRQIETLVEEMLTSRIAFDSASLEFVLRRTLERLTDKWHANPSDVELLERIHAAAAMARSLPFEVHLWHVQNVFYSMLQTVYPDCREEAASSDTARRWTEYFLGLGRSLMVRVE